MSLSPKKAHEMLSKWDTEWYSRSIDDIVEVIGDENRNMGQALITMFTTEEWKSDPFLFEKVVMGLQNIVDFESYQLAHPAFIASCLIIDRGVSEAVKSYIRGCCEYYGYGGFGPITFVEPLKGDRQEEKVRQALKFIEE